MLPHNEEQFGCPCVIIAMDDEPNIVGNTRMETEKTIFKYFIRSKKVIMAGPLYLSTEIKDDPSSIPVGDLIMFHVPIHEEVIEFVENLLAAQEGSLYGRDLLVHF
jgi:hypothetical protein